MIAAVLSTYIPNLVIPVLLLILFIGYYVPETQGKELQDHIVEEKKNIIPIELEQFDEEASFVT